MLTLSTFVDGSSTRAVGQYARLYDHTGTQQVVADIIDSQTGEIDHEATALASDALGVGTFALTDIRDSKDYLVRRLADGNCWMVQNLDLELANFAGKDNTNGGLTPANTDLQDSGRSYWDPSESTQAKINSYKNNADWPTTGDDDFSNLAQYVLGTTVTHSQQFQSYNIGSDGYFWVTKCSAPGVCGNEFAFSVQSEIPRSYSNMVTSDQSTDFDKATQFRYVPTNWKTGLTRDQVKASGSEYPSTNPSVFNIFPEGQVTSTSLYSPSTRASSATSSSDYWANADNTYYGNMYIGHYYNFYAATAETGKVIVAKANNDSICPAGWGLPSAYNQRNNYYNLVRTVYKLTTADGDQTDSNTPQGTAYGPAVDMHKLPISIPFAGRYQYQTGNVVDRALGGYYITSEQSTSALANALDFAFHSTFAKTDYGHDKSYGYTIRCVAHGSELNSSASQEAVATTCSAGKICYDGNGGSGEMNDQSASANSSVVLTAPTFTRLGYSFAGWSTQDNGFGTVYGPNETITTPSNLATTGLRLYAKWLPSTGTMQDFTTAQCNALGTHQSVALTDNRDGNTYTVTKLKDGNCWMTTNLALNLADFAGDNPTKGYLTTANTDIGNDKDGSGNPTRTDLINITSTNGGNSGLYRWDPMKSTLIKAQNIVNAEGYNGPALAADNSNYFDIVSANYLGAPQTAQFQSGDQYGSNWYWGSKCSAVSTCDTSTEAADNKLSEIPRSYNANTTD